MPLQVIVAEFVVSVFWSEVKGQRFQSIGCDGGTVSSRLARVQMERDSLRKGIGPLLR